MGEHQVKEKAIKFLYAFECYLLYVLSSVVASFAVVVYYSVVAAQDVGALSADVDANVFFEYIANILSGKSSLVLFISYILVLLVTIIVFAAKKIKLGAYTGFSYCRPISLIASVCLGALLNLIVSYFVPAQSGGEVEIVPLMIICVLLGPIVEEIVFRGILLKMFGAAVGVFFSIVITALLFSVSHAISQADMVQVIYTFVLGILLGVVRYKSTSLWSAIAVHMSFNLSSAFFGWFNLDLDGADILLCAAVAVVMFFLSCTGGRKVRKKL